MEAATQTDLFQSLHFKCLIAKSALTSGLHAVFVFQSLVLPLLTYSVATCLSCSTLLQSLDLHVVIYTIENCAEDRLRRGASN